MEKATEAGKLPANEIAAKLTNAFQKHDIGEWSSVISNLSNLMPETVRIGGSRAQRDLVQNTLISACIKDGRPEQARLLLEMQRERTQTIPVPGFKIS